MDFYIHLILNHLKYATLVYYARWLKDPFTGYSERVTSLLGLIHTDVCGPSSIVARGGYHYFITFTDDFSRYGYGYGYVLLMRHKFISFEMFKPFLNEVQTQLGKTFNAP